MITPKHKKLNNRLGQLRSDALNMNTDALFLKKNSRTKQDEFSEMETIQLTSQASSYRKCHNPLPKKAFLHEVEDESPVFPNSVSFTSIGNTDSLSQSPFLPSPFSLDSDESWTSYDFEGSKRPSSRSASTQPSSQNKTASLLYSSHGASHSAGQLDRLPSLLSSNKNTHRHAHTRSPLLFQAPKDSRLILPSLDNNLTQAYKNNLKPLKETSKASSSRVFTPNP